MDLLAGEAAKAVMIVEKGAPLVLAPLLLLLSGSLGNVVLRKLVRNDVDARNQDELVAAFPFLSMLFGAVIVGLVVYLLSLVGQLTPLSMKLLLAAQFILLVFNTSFLLSIGQSIEMLWSLIRLAPWVTRLVSILALAIYLTFLALGLLAALLPTIEADSATSYLNAANLFLQYHELIDVGHFVGDMGKTGFLHLVYPMGLLSGSLAHAWVFILAATGIFLLFLLTGFLSGFFVSSVLLVLLLSSHFVYDWILIPTKFDGIAIALSSAILLMFHWSDHGGFKLRMAAPIGVMLGFLAGLSYNNVFAAGVFFAWAIFSIWKSEDARAMKVLHLVLASVIGSAPTYLHNIFLFSNPVYPFAGSVFGSGLGKGIPVDSYAYQYIQEIGSEFAARSLPEVFVPLRLLYQHGYHPEMQAQMDPLFASIWLVALGGGAVHLAWAFSARLREGPFRARLPMFSVYAIFGLWVVYLAWAGTQHILRYLSAAIPFAFVTIAILATASHGQRSGWRTFSVRAGFAVVLGLALLYWIPFGVNGSLAHLREVRTWVLGSQTVDDFLRQKFVYGSGLRFGESIVAIKSELKNDDKILSFITGNYYFGENVKTFSGNGSSTLPSPHAMPKSLGQFSSYVEWEETLRKQGFCCIVLNPDYLYLTEKEQYVVRGYLRNRKPSYSIQGTDVYLIR